MAENFRESNGEKKKKLKSPTRSERQWLLEACSPVLFFFLSLYSFAQGMPPAVYPSVEMQKRRGLLGQRVLCGSQECVRDPGTLSDNQH